MIHCHHDSFLFRSIFSSWTSFFSFPYFSPRNIPEITCLLPHHSTQRRVPGKSSVVTMMGTVSLNIKKKKKYSYSDPVPFWNLHKDTRGNNGYQLADTEILQKQAH